MAYLVSPVGVRYPITDLTAQEDLGIWSATARTMLIRKQTDSGPSYLQVDMTSGQSRAFPISGNPYEFTSDGRQIFTSDPTNGTMTLSSSDGTVVLTTYPSSEPGLGTLQDGPWQSPGGTTLAFGADHGLAVLSLSGQLIRALPAPQANQGCSPLSFGPGNVIVARCDDMDISTGVPHSSVWSIPVSGDAPTRLRIASSANISKPGYFGYSDVWRTSAGEFGAGLNSCGPATLVRFDNKGQPVPVAVTYPPGAAPGDLAYVSHDGEDVTLLDQDGFCNSPSNSLIRYDTVTGSTLAVLGPGANGGTVDEVVPFGGHL